MTLAQSFKNGLDLNPDSQQRGYSDGLLGKPWVPREGDDWSPMRPGMWTGVGSGAASKGAPCPVPASSS